MAKFYGPVGYAESVEKEPGIWVENIIEKKHPGDVLSNFRNLQNSGNINDNIDIANKISIVSNPYANQNFHSMRYVKYMGTAWKIKSVEVQYPRLILTLGGVYNGPQAGTT